MNGTIRKIVSGTAWGIAAKVITSALNFVSLPLVITYFGKENYGLVALVISTNAFLQILNMGIPMGAVNFFSQWRARGEIGTIERASQSSVLFYSFIGLLNAVALLCIAFFSRRIFTIPPEKISLFNELLIILALSSVVNWAFNVVQNILNAYEDVAWLQKIYLATSLLRFAGVLATIYLKMGLVGYFVLYLLPNLVVIPLYVGRMKKHGLSPLKMLKPKWHYADFKVILQYSSLLFTMSFFIYLGDHFRPVLLAARSIAGLKAVADFSIIQNITSTIAFLGSIALQPMLPATAKAIAAGETETVNQIVCAGTRYLTCFLTLVVILTVLCSEKILLVYVGPNNLYLAKWLSIGSLALLGMHNQALSSYILAKGNIRPLAICSSAAAVGSLSIVFFLAPHFNVGAAVLAYLAYKIIELLFVYCWYLPKYSPLDSKMIFVENVLPSLLIGFVVLVLSKLAMEYLTEIHNGYAWIVIATIICVVSYTLLAFRYVIDFSEVKSFFKYSKRHTAVAHGEA